SLHDSERAYEVTEMLLALVPDDLAAFDRLERIDASCQRYDRLLATLETRLQYTPTPERPLALLRIAELALEQLNDIPKALAACRQALTLAPAARDLWPRAAQVFADA